MYLRYAKCLRVIVDGGEAFPSSTVIFRLSRLCIPEFTRGYLSEKVRSIPVNIWTSLYGPSILELLSTVTAYLGTYLGNGTLNLVTLPMPV